MRILLVEDDLSLVTGLQQHRLGVGGSFSEYWFGEVYLIGERDSDNSFAINGVELEAQWQLSEQGEYFADWGLLFEIERERGGWEVSVGLLAEKEWGRWISTANFFAIYEWGGVEEEFETALALQGRYRYTRMMEPAWEFQIAENNLTTGPVLMGTIPFGLQRKLHWEFGTVFGLDSVSPNVTVKGLLEYEF